MKCPRPILQLRRPGIQTGEANISTRRVGLYTSLTAHPPSLARGVYFKMGDLMLVLAMSEVTPAQRQYIAKKRYK